jgi:hypothetical protein
MKTINVTAIMEVPDNYTPDQVYADFENDWLRPAVESGDLSCFVFANAETGVEIEYEEQHE